ncbi:YceD family protein [Haloimpatiens sp. FM7315]|uniref:YceD family protein n=1 Tax=Haloimpatiens sp. FM7315 TaxID=3298609 RepID=UPI00370A54D4
MIINVSDVLKKRVEREEFNFILKLSEFSDGGEIVQVIEPMKVTGSVRLLDEQLVLKAHVVGVLKLTCSRCLEKFNYQFDMDFQERLSDKYDNEDDDIIFIDNNKLNLTDIIINNIIISLPIKRLCREDCKGLCQICGTNLNFSDCTCKEEDVDPRLSKLKDFFSAN